MDLDSLLADLQQTVRETQPQLAVRDVLDRALADPGWLVEAFPCERAELVPLLSSDDLTVIKTVWCPGMNVPPHDHRMWGAIGVFGGKEQNSFWRRAGDGIEASGRRELAAGDVGLMGDDTIHSVTSPGWTGAIHVYGGDFVSNPRSMWVDGEERPHDGRATQAIFEAANRDAQRGELNAP